MVEGKQALLTRRPRSPARYRMFSARGGRGALCTHSTTQVLKTQKVAGACARAFTDGSSLGAFLMP